MKTAFDTLTFGAIFKGENLHLIEISMFKQLQEDMILQVIIMKVILYEKWIMVHYIPILYLFSPKNI